MKQAAAEELIYQTLETEQCGVRIYRQALECVEHQGLRLEWREYLRQTERHEQIVRDLCDKLSIPISKETPGRLIVRAKAEALIQAMKAALAGGDLAAAQIVAAECVVDAATKDHQNWTLVREVSSSIVGDEGRAMREAFDQIEEEEDEHLYHTMGWVRELWLQSLGLPVELPPAEEKKDVKTAIGAARARQARKPKDGGVTHAYERWQPST